MGGLNPLRSLLPGCIPPPKRCQESYIQLVAVKYHALWGKPPKGQPFGGVSRVVLPKMAPLISGLLGFAGSIPGRYSYRFLTDLYRLSWEIILVTSRVTFHIDYLFTWLHVFFPDDVLWRNQIIKEVVLVEASSILPLPRCLESY